MVIEKASKQTDILVEEIIRGIQEKMGKDITCLDLARVNSTVCDYFIVCHGTSTTHVSAIAESVEDQVDIHTGMKPSRREGFSNAEWILLDYLDVVVHVFQQEIRDHYKLEELWADAPVIHIPDEAKIENQFQERKNW